MCICIHIDKLFPLFSYLNKLLGLSRQILVVPAPQHIVVIHVHQLQILAITIHEWAFVKFAEIVCAVARTQSPLTDHRIGNDFQIIRPAHPGEEIDETGGEIKHIIAQFGGLVIPGEHMVVVVPALADRHKRDVLVVRWLDVSARRDEHMI